MPDDLLSRARRWIDQDPDPDTRAELHLLIDNTAAGDPTARTALAERFAGSLEFGTAGLRGRLGAGPMRMNRVTVLRAAAALAGYLTAMGESAGLVVIGYDARHKSRVFARDTAAVLAGAGLRAAVLPRPLPTPVLAFAVRHLQAAAGVMVTASHNPPQDNGYKVYLGDGSQIIPPVDTQIAAEIHALDSVDQIPRATAGWETLSDDIVEAYLRRATSLLTPGSPRSTTVAYTPLHGVGGDVLTAAFERSGFASPAVVAAQAAPDPDFPTVAFPNPEEPGAMDMVLQLAQHTRPDIVIANDPDADRCAVAIPDATARNGWRMLTGDEVGALLAHHMTTKTSTGTFASSIVSSSLIAAIAARAGLTHTETLTGFKWISRAPDLRYGYEEALGYCVDPDAVRDKDGITAALLVAELVATVKHAGRTVDDLLDQLALAHGLHVTDQLSVRVADLALIDNGMTRLRRQPPRRLAGLTVVATEDLTTAGDGLPPTDALRYRLLGDHSVEAARIVVRPSGTEPKLKAYLEVTTTIHSRADLAAARADTTRVVHRLKQDLAAAAGLPTPPAHPTPTP